MSRGWLGLAGLIAAYWLASLGYRPWKTAEPDLAAAHLRLAGHYAGQGRLEDAIAQSGAAVRTAPESPLARYNLGWFLAAAGRSAEAEPELRYSMALAPQFALPRIELARILAARGETEEAAALLRATAPEAGN